jgi:hypothetical protein
MELPRPEEAWAWKFQSPEGDSSTGVIAEQRLLAWLKLLGGENSSIFSGR